MKRNGQKAELRMPMQDGPDLPEHVGRALWTIYAEVHGTQQSYERIVERHGFGYAEVPIWIEDLKRRRARELATAT